MRRLPAFLPLLCTALLVAQDPSPPPEGFPIASIDYAPNGPGLPVTWVDGALTSLEIYFPTVTPPVTGWPIVMLFHGTGGTRNLQPIVQRATYLAQRGYVCIAYDLRGEGDTLLLNSGSWDSSEAARMRDIAEASARTAEWLPPSVLADATRIAVTGESMGGRQAYRAAAWSGQPLPIPAGPQGPYTSMPEIGAIAPRVAPLDLLGDSVRDGILMNAETADAIYDGYAGSPSPTVTPVIAALALEQYALLVGLMALEETNDYLTRLRTSSVPMLISNVWDDAKHPTLPIADALATLPATTPVQFLLTTNGHSSASNEWEQFANDEKIRRWFDHFLKGVPNGVDLEPRVEIALPPDNELEHLSPLHPWGHAMLDQWRPNVASQTLYLREPSTGRELSTTPPSAAEPGVVISNLPQIGYGMLQYLPQNRHVPTVKSHFVPELEVFPGPPLGSDLELLGRPRFIARVVSTAGDFYLTVRLFSVAPNGDRKMLTAGTHGVRGGQPGQHDLVVDLEDVGCIVPAGHRLEVDLLNLAIHQCANTTFLRWVPCFVPSNTTVLLTPATPAQLELPYRSRPHGFIAPRFRTIAASSATATWEVSGGSSRAGEPYLVLLSQSGCGPGTLLSPELVPINLDAWTWLVLGAPTAPFFPGFSGQLDAVGKAAATIDLSLVGVPPVLLGLRFTLGTVGLDAGGYWGGGPAEFEFVP